MNKAAFFVGAALLLGVSAFGGCGLDRSGVEAPVSAASCDTAVQCKSDDPCKLGQCGEDKLCTLVPLPDGEPLLQPAGDCARVTCAAGEAMVAPDPDDSDDHNPCTLDDCAADPIHEPIDGVLCPVGPSTGTCEAGECVVSCGPDDPPAKCDDGKACTSDSCNVGEGRCEHVPLDGTPLEDTSQSDCVDLFCIDGEPTLSPDDSESSDDGNDCTTDACVDGQPSSSPVAQGTPCQAGECNASGQCVGCNRPTDCFGSDDACKTRSCSAGICGFVYQPWGTPANPGPPDDCLQEICDGAGGTQVAPSDGETPPDDGLECTWELCQGGSASHPPLSAGSPCPSNGFRVCNGSGYCVDCVSDPNCPPPLVCDPQQGKCCDDPQLLCSGRCGTVTDTCGAGVDCGGCPPGETCTGNVCGCVSDPQPTTCGSQCGFVVDNCGVPVDCGGCNPGDTCVANACVCEPDPYGVTCPWGSCGTVVNNCSLNVSCPSCAPQEICDGVTNTCCHTCASLLKTCGSVPDGCGGTLNCDGVHNGTETGVDCGGGSCPTCGTGQGCMVGGDCSSGVCTAGFICQ